MRIEDVQESAAAVLLPPPDLSVSQWSDANRRLSSESAAERGEWRTDRAPYQRAVMDALSPSHPCEQIVLMSGAQLGKTSILENFIGYIVDLDAGPILLVEPREADAESFSKDRLAPMLRDTPCLRGKVADSRSRDSNNTVLHKKFTGGSITLSASNSPAGLAMRSIRYCLLDEVDRYPASAGSEGDPVNLAITRTANFWNRKIVLCSTPTVKDASRIAAAWEESNQQSYWVPCPKCETFQVLRWGNVTWPKGRPEKAQYRCDNKLCGELIGEHHKAWMLARGEWRAARPESEIQGFWISGLYSPWRKWTDLARKWLADKKSPERLREFINTVLAEVWEDETGGTNTDVDSLLARREDYDSEDRLPPGVVLITAGADVQMDRIEVELVGWGRDEESWSLGYAILPGDTVQAEVWDALDQVLGISFHHPHGPDLVVAAACVDAGYRQPIVQAWCNERSHRHIFPTKGAAGQRPVWARAPSKSADKRPLWIVGSDSAKEAITARLRIAAPGPGYCHWPINDVFDRTYFEQLNSGICKIKYNRGFAHREWSKKPDTRDEALDCRCYAYAALQAAVMAGLRLNRQADHVAEMGRQKE
jgi:phage terminase large subunit GpA-like protein